MSAYLLIIFFHLLISKKLLTTMAPHSGVRMRQTPETDSGLPLSYGTEAPFATLPLSIIFSRVINAHGRFIKMSS